MNSDKVLDKEKTITNLPARHFRRVGNVDAQLSGNCRQVSGGKKDDKVEFKC